MIKKTCRHTGVCPSFVHFSASKKTKWTLKGLLHVKNPAVVHYTVVPNTVIRALKRFFLLVEIWVLCTLINCFHCSAREIVLLDEQKIARTFSNDKGVSNFAGMENYIMVKQSGRWLNELNSRNTFSVYYAKFFRLLRFFDCMKTQAMSKFCNGI